MGLCGTFAHLSLKWTANTERLEETSRKVAFKIKDSSNDKGNGLLFNARTVASLGLPEQSIQPEELGENYSHLRRIPLESYENATSHFDWN